jgi:hypothetical protein
MANLSDYDKKVHDTQDRAKAALDAVLSEPFEPAHFNPYDYDLDTRWITVTAFTTFVHKGRRFRLSIEEVVGLCGV